MHPGLPPFGDRLPGTRPAAFEISLGGHRLLGCGAYGVANGVHVLSSRRGDGYDLGDALHGSRRRSR